MITVNQPFAHFQRYLYIYLSIVCHFCRIVESLRRPFIASRLSIAIVPASLLYLAFTSQPLHKI